MSFIEFIKNTENWKMCDKNTVWIEENLIPIIVNRHKSVFEPSKNVILKDVHIKSFDNDGIFLMTLCYKLNIVLDVNGDEQKLSIFVKVRLHHSN